MNRPMPQLLNTESPSQQHTALDQYDSAALVAALVDDQSQAVAAVQAAAPLLAQAVDAAVPRLRAGGRLLYAGAGSSGRLGQNAGRTKSFSMEGFRKRYLFPDEPPPTPFNGAPL